MSYLLNLSGDFDAGNIIPAFLPYTADKSLHLFKELTQHSLPEKDQEDAINEKLGILKEHFDNQRLSLTGDAQTLNIGVILGYDYWLFTEFGQLSRLPIFKVKYIREKFNLFFKKQKSTLRIYYFITGLKSKPYVALFNHIEKTGYLPESGETPTETIDFKWMKRSTLLSPSLQEVRNTTLLKENDPITEAMARSIEGFRDNWKKNLEEYFTKLHVKAGTLFSDIVTHIDTSFASIRTVNHYHSIKFIKIADDFFLKNFSLKEGLQSNETLVRYYIDDRNAAANLKSRYGFACLILECLTKDLLSNNSIRYYQIAELTLNEAVMSTYFAKLNQLADNNKVKLLKTDSNTKFPHLFYKVAENDVIQIGAKLDNADYVSFKSHVNIRNAIGNFFSFDLRKKIGNMLNEKNLIQLESKIFSQINELFFSPDYLDRHSEQVESTYQEISNKLYELQRDSPQLASSIDHEAYLKVKHELEPLIDQKRSELIESLAALPRQIQVWLALGAGSIAVLLFGFPLYSMLFPLHALGLWMLFLGISLISVFVILRHIKGKLNTQLLELEIYHEKLFEALKQFSQQIEDVARDYKKTMIYKKNINVLQSILNDYNQTSLKRNEYIAFLEKIKLQISDIMGPLQLELQRIQYEGLINDLIAPPMSNKAFTGLLSGSSAKKIEFRYPSHEPFEMEVSYDTLLSHIEFE